MKSIIRITFFITLLFFLSSCGNNGGKETLKAHEIELPNGIESKLPIPKESKITFKVAKDGKHSVMFSPSLNYPESVAFFSENISSDDWEIEESISERKEGERKSSWELTGHNVKVRLNVSTFGGEKGTGTSGFYHIESTED